MTEASGATSAPYAQPSGRVFRWAFAYDLLLNIIWHGSERTYREKTLEHAGLRTGESVLDVGCGTGTLAIAAKRRVGPTGRIFGLDASREMISRARKKATGARAGAEALPFADATFDVVLSTTVFHCLPNHTRDLCIREMVRVLKPNGRLLLIDFGGSKRERHSLIGHLRAHRNFDVFDLIPTINESGLTDLKNGSLGFSDLQFLIATRSGSTSLRSG